MFQTSDLFIVMKLAALLLASLAPLGAQPDRVGSPDCAGESRELADRSYFLLCYDSSLKVLLWTAYELTPDRLVRAAGPGPRHFRHDTALLGPIARNADYRASRFSRGPWCPPKTSWSEEAMRATFCDLNHRLAGIGSIVWPEPATSPLDASATNATAEAREASLGQKYGRPEASLGRGYVG